MLRLPVLIVNRSRTSLVVILLVITGLNSNVWSQQPIPTPEDLLYRQVKVEEGDLDEVLAGTIPVLRSQFNLMVGAINSQTRQQLEELPDYRQGVYPSGFVLRSFSGGANCKWTSGPWYRGSTRCCGLDSVIAVVTSTQFTSMGHPSGRR